MIKTKTSWKHSYIILTPLNPFLYSKTGVYRGIHYFSYFCSKIDCGYSLEPPRRELESLRAAKTHDNDIFQPLNIY